MISELEPEMIEFYPDHNDFNRTIESLIRYNCENQNITIDFSEIEALIEMDP
jgi:hypothetical protein